ncbi:hypothetical protein GF339_15020, partial [candidate division KSB3 bacterium]|nr:hypothetical protein [candidate division KSB3 bacterium]MBD3325896.1 hypothetical protein [candidate division KSB3 bacterium]
MADNEWQAILSQLEEQRAWESLWRLLHTAPVIWAKRGLLQLKDAGWLPDEDRDRSTFILLTDLAEAFRYEQPDPTGGIVKNLPVSDAVVPDAQMKSLINSLKLLDGQEKYFSIFISHAVITPDRKLLITAKSSRRDPFADCIRGGDIQFWRLPRGKLLKTLTFYDEGIATLALSPDGTALLTVSNGPSKYTVSKHEACLWRLPKGNRLNWLGISMGDYRFSFNATSTLLLGYRENGKIRVWRLSDGKEISLPDADFTLSSDGQILVRAGEEQPPLAQVWDVLNQTLLVTLQEEADSVTSVAISPDREVIVIGHRDRTVRLWSRADGALLTTLTGHTAEVH